MSISNKQFKTFARDLGVDVAHLKALASAESIQSGDDLADRIDGLTEEQFADLQAGTLPAAAADTGSAAGGVEEPAATATGGLTEQAVAAACKTHGIPRAGWHRFLTGSGPADLPTLLPGRTFTADQVLGVWKSGGKGMNVRKLVGRLARTA